MLYLFSIIFSFSNWTFTITSEFTTLTFPFSDSYPDNSATQLYVPVFDSKITSPAELVSPVCVPKLIDA